MILSAAGGSTHVTGRESVTTSWTRSRVFGLRQNPESVRDYLKPEDQPEQE